MPYKDRAKQRQYQLVWAKNRRQRWLEENGPCKVCSSYNRLEIDHVNPTSKSSVLKLYRTNSFWSWAEKRLAKELEKCQVLCHKCHAEKTWKAHAAPHGTDSRYRSTKQRRCRCDLCRMAHARAKTPV